MYTRIYLLSVLVVSAVLVLDVIGMQGMSVKHQFYDVILHFLGGFGAGLFGAAFIHLRPSRFSMRREWQVVLFVLLVAIVWEIFEMSTNTSGYVLWTAGYYADTVKDISMGLIGSVLAIFLAKHVWRNGR